MSSTEEQAQVIANPNQNKLLCALPGSGKTHTMVELASNILKQPDARILMVTFTNSAAKEMQERIIKKLGKKLAKRVRATTFAKIMLEQHKPLANGRRLIISGEYSNYIHRVCKKVGIKHKSIPTFESYVEEKGRELHFESTNDSLSAGFIELQNMMALYNRVDLQTVAREVVLGLQSGQISPLPFTNYLIDEFQDTDFLQYQWLQLQKREGVYFCVVGDDDQSIYSWRGAVGYQNMVNFQRGFAATGYLLSVCFRCSPLILNKAKVLIEHSSERIHKNMVSGRDIRGKVEVRVFASNMVSPFTKKLNATPEALRDRKLPFGVDESSIEGYRYIVDCIETEYDQWTILCRTNQHLDALEFALAERGIPAARLGGKSIFDSPHAVGFAKLLVGLVFPKAKLQLVDGLGWAGEDETVLQNMFYTIRDGGFSLVPENENWLEVTNKLHSIVSRWRETFRDEATAVNYISKLSSIMMAHFENTELPDKKQRSALVNAIAKMLIAMNGNLPDRVKKLYEMVTQGLREKPTHLHPGKIILCTMTGSKGLEWKKVFIMMINRKIIPSKVQDYPVDSEEWARKDEERRLLYVAMTRAEDELILHWHDGKHSCFIEELGYINEDEPEQHEYDAP